MHLLIDMPPDRAYRLGDILEQDPKFTVCYPCESKTAQDIITEAECQNAEALVLEPGACTEQNIFFMKKLMDKIGDLPVIICSASETKWQEVLGTKRFVYVSDFCAHEQEAFIEGITAATTKTENDKSLKILDDNTLYL